ncbi:MAG TPA: signal peptide peptidase SppA [Kofleriaceae bacterium]|nr:signal peptide peptidase SppA [Kofleriaceae bacterium]
MRSSVVLAVCLHATVAHAQGALRSYAEEPTDGLALPTAPLAGEFDGRVVATNPGGLPMVRGSELALVLGLEDADVATSAGQGFGAYYALAGGGRLLPRFGLGLGLEWLRPARANLDPDPGEPFRFTLGLATALGKTGGLGVSWHHFSAEGALAGRDTFDLGLSGRWGNHVAFGATLRDLATKPVDGVPVQRRYEAELLARPFAVDALEVAVGGRLGERRLDADGWARLSARITSGVNVHAAFESRSTYALVDSPVGRREDDGRELRGTVGLEVSFGSLGVTTLATGLRSETTKGRFLGGQLVLRSSSLPTKSVLGLGDHIERVELSGTIGLRELTAQVARLRSIARDDTVKAIVVTFDGLSGGWATLQELRDELLAVRAAGKKVYAYMVAGTGRDYFVASAANKIYIDPAGGVRLVGMAGTTIFFKGAFDQLGVVPQFEKIAEYKTAPEQFTERAPSPTAAAMNNELFDSLWDQFLSQVADARKLSKDELRAIVDAGPYSAGDLAASSKLVDAVAAPDKISQLVMADIGRVIPVGARTAERPDRWKRPGIAIVYVDGDITDGASRSIPFLGQSLAGGETLVAAIATARASPDIGAIILRIDSPGGSAIASELVSREVFATRGVKPIVCSFSDLAASGGYFVAAGCDVILAKPMTITGSIGIFYGKFDLSGLLAKVGITTDTYKRGKRADVESLYRPYSAEERSVLMDKLAYMYGRFVGAVAEGRGMKKDEVDQVGRGHVWSGAMAKDKKLVDRFGGLGDAIDEAKKRMGLTATTRVQLYELPNLPSSIFGRLGRLVGVRAEDTVAPTDLPMLRELLRGVPSSVLVSPSSPQARLPFDLSWTE